jgi:flagellar basal body-associated protein FliL
MFDDDDYINNQDDENSNSNLALIIAGIVGAAITGAIGLVWHTAHEGKAVSKARKEAYIEASELYENKLKELTKEFLSKKKDWEKNKEEYDYLLVQYENYIQELNMKIEKNDDKVTSKSIRKVIKNMESKRDALKRLRDDEDDTSS